MNMDDVTEAQWTSWRWQQQNSITDVRGLLKVFPELPEQTVQAIKDNTKDRRLSITPYTLSLIERERGAPKANDPLWRSLVPTWRSGGALDGEYDGKHENWEMPAEMKTPICQHKYPDRVILRLANTCHAYCQFCYEALRTLEKKPVKEALKISYWNETIEYIKNNDEIQEVILSGGEPLMLADEKIGFIFESLRSVNRDLAIRVHTRALTFNPFRITDGLLEVFRRHKITALGIHVSHPNEISGAFAACIKKISQVCPILFANITLLAGINDNAETLKTLCGRLYRMGVVPYYLYHFMPFSPGLGEYRTDIRKGIEIMNQMKRHVSNMAVPEYVVPHATGKYTVPLDEGAVFCHEDDGTPVFEFVNWKGEVVRYSNVCS